MIVGAVVLLGLFGWAQGFISGVLALVGFVAGAWLGTRIAPLVLSGGRESPWAPAFALIGAIVAGGVLAAGLRGCGRAPARPLTVARVRRRSTVRWARSSRLAWGF